MDTRLPALVIVGIVVVAGCGGTDEPAAGASTVPAATVPAAPVSTATAPPAAPIDPMIAWRTGAERDLDAVVIGTVFYQDDCLLLQYPEVSALHPIIWPAGTAWSSDTNEVVLADGSAVPVGAVIEGGGGGSSSYNFEPDYLNDLAGAGGETLLRCMDVADADKAVRFDASGTVSVYTS